MTKVFSHPSSASGNFFTRPTAAPTAIRPKKGTISATTSSMEGPQGLSG